ncbi:MAG TPA: iron ABC transporter permease [Ignavibacteria bacterium]
MQKKIFILIISFIALFIAVLASISLGSANIKLIEIFSIFSTDNDIIRKIIFEYRLPRVLNSVIVGASLSCSGFVLQTLLRNNLAEPGLLGISAGAGFGAIIVFTFVSFLPFELLTPISFVFALITTYIIFLIANSLSNKYSNFISSNKIILAGIAINALVSSINAFFMIKAGNNVSQIIYWLNGGFNGKGWNEFYMSTGFVLIGIVSAVLISKDLNILNLGEEISVNLGLNIKKIQTLSIIISSLLAASAVAVAGIISFVGLIIPNIARLIIGSDYRYSIPFSVILGSLFLVIADLISRTIISPSEIPVGIITSFIGAPVFIWLILKKKNL